jgi:chromosomal replication initiator protein
MLGSCLMVFINRPDYKTRLEILKVKVKDFNIQINESVLDFLAQKVDSGGRSLEVILITLIANGSISKKKSTSQWQNHTWESFLNELIEHARMG